MDLGRNGVSAQRVDPAPRSPEVGVLAAHDAVITH